MVVTKGILWIIIPGVVFSVAFAFIASLLDNEILHVLFGIFLILIAVYEFLGLYFGIREEKEIKSKKKN
jgi:uncharacterized membrane protein YfcA